MTLRCVAIPRVDPGAQGIHLAWTGPPMIGLSVKGYDIQRRAWKESRHPERCELIGPPELATLRTRNELLALLGPLLYRRATAFTRLDDPALYAPQAQPLPEPGPHAAGSRLGGPAVALASAQAEAAVQPSSELPAGEIDKILTAHFAGGGSLLNAVTGAALECFTQELQQPTDLAVLTVQAGAAFALALSAGKVVSTASSTAAGTSVLRLPGQLIDTVVLYTLRLSQFSLCVVVLSDKDRAGWAQAPYIVRGLTLPIHEADPSLSPGAAELARAESRLLAGETLTAGEFDSLTPTLREGAARVDLGRPGERILLVRSDAGQPFEEVPFETQLSTLQVHPRWRRILGFGHADRHGLVPGETYEYLITGHFEAHDLDDDIYDVHAVPAGTVLPACVRIRDLVLRFPQPAQVVLDPAASPGDLLAISRRGIAVAPPDGEPWWVLPSLDGWSLVADLPAPTRTVVLEVADGHSFSYAGGDGWLPFGPSTPLAGAGSVRLDFPAPITQLRLEGGGVLFALRLPSGPGGVLAQSVESGPVRFAAEPLPDPPSILVVYNLQAPPAVLTGDLGEQTQVPARPDPGFNLVWLPAVLSGIGFWPSDLGTDPPIDAIAYQIEHRQVSPGPPGAWEPIQSGDNLTLGSRNDARPAESLSYGADLWSLYAQRPPPDPGAGYALHLRDIFGVKDPETGAVRPAPPLGSYHQYRIRSMDTVGRVSGSWTTSPIVRLEKRIPPPPPVGPQPPAAVIDLPGGGSKLGGAMGVKGRALVQGQPNMTPEDVALLGAHDNAVVLEWGWRAEERDLDPTTEEFRLYLTQHPPDIVPGTITGVAASGDGWDLSFVTDRWLQADEAAGQWITSGGYPFQIEHHGTGDAVTIHVRRAEANPSATPAPGPTMFGRPHTAYHQRPAYWEARVAVVPLAAADSYRYVYYDVLTLGPDTVVDTVWVGVTAADAQPYVPDELPPWVLNGGRPGNESSVATAVVTGRYHGRPSFSIPPPLGDVPVLVTEEPTGRQVLVALDLDALVPGALPDGTPIALDRCSGDSIFDILALDAGGNITLRLKDGTLQTVTFLNPGDEAAVTDMLNSDHPEWLPNRYLLYLVTQHSRPDEIFERVSGQTFAFGTVSDRLPPKPDRFFYRLRQADSSGRVSAGGGILPIVVRVPSVAPAAQPQRLGLQGDAAGAHLRVRVVPDPSLTHLLLFSTATAAGAPVPPGDAELLRVPNRRDLYPHDGIRLRTPDGVLVSPAVKDLSDPDVAVEPDGSRTTTLTATAPAGSYVRLWCYALSEDGIPSKLAGPFGVGIPVLP